MYVATNQQTVALYDHVVSYCAMHNFNPSMDK